MSQTTAAAADSSSALTVGLLLFPGFQTLDAFGPLDVINSLSRSRPITLCLIAESMEPVSNKPHAPVNTMSPNCEQRIVPTHTFNTAPPLDVLIVPGGFGTRSPAHDVTGLVAFIKKSYPDLQAIISVCTGSGLLARAGILDGKRATSNKNAWDDMTVLGPKTFWVAQARWVQDGNIWTAAGVTAGIDATLAWVAATVGEEKAQTIADYLEYNRVARPEDDPFATLRGIQDVPPSA